jgi:hypothetical protein
VVLFNGLRINLAAFSIVIFFASASLAAAKNLSLPSDTIAQTMHPTIESPIKTAVGINNAFFTEYFTNLRSVIAAHERKDMPVGAMTERFIETAAISLHKDGDKIIWSLAPSLNKFSLNPIDDIKKLEVLLQYSFWF